MSIQPGRKLSYTAGNRSVTHTTPRNQRRNSWAPQTLLAENPSASMENYAVALPSDHSIGSSEFDFLRRGVADTGVRRRTIGTIDTIAEQRRASQLAVWDALAHLRLRNDLTENLKGLKWVAAGDVLREQMTSSPPGQNNAPPSVSSRTPTPPPVSAPTQAISNGFGESLPFAPHQSAPSGWPEKPQVIDEAYRQNMKSVLSALTEFSLKTSMSVTSALGEETNEVTNKIDQELARLRPQLRATRKNVAIQRRELKVSRDTEVQAKKVLWARQMETDKKVLEVVTRLQRSFRAYMVRKKILDYQKGEQQKIQLWVSALPQQLASNLYSMRLDIYKLRYRHCDRLAAVLRLQAWWRTLLVRRVAVVIRCAAWMRILHDKMSTAAVKLQSRFRSRATRKSFLAVLQIKIRERKERQIKQVMEANFHIIRIQRAFRLKLSKRRMAELRQAQVGTLAHRNSVLESVRFDVRQAALESIRFNPVPPTQFIDSWSPRKSVLEHMPLHDELFRNFTDAGQVPFYCRSAALQLPRHHIGGSSALDAKQALRKGSASSSCGRDLSFATGSAAMAKEACLVLDQLGVYPHGNSFQLASLGPDALGDFATEGRCLAERDGRSRKGERGERTRRPRRTRPLNSLVPSNTKQRAGRQRFGQCVGIANDVSGEDVSNPHPLLVVSRPSPPPMPQPSPRPPEVALRPRPLSLVLC